MQIIKDRGSVYCNNECWDTLNNYLLSQAPSKLFVLTDSNTKESCLPHFLKKCKWQNSFEILEMPEGEKHKTLETCSQLWNDLSEKGADRKSILINLGGGVVTDMGGFIASTFKRGIEFINIPTSLLAMVDASVGGKNGIDLGVIKNQIGIIRNPKMVIVDTSYLQTLPKAHMISGLAEMLKHGLISNKPYWESVKMFNAEAPLSMEDLVWESIQIKNKIVTEDPLEMGNRKALNYGHTLGHAIESYCLKNENMPTLLHGEAIAIGMILATFISSEKLSFPKEILADVSAHIMKLFPKIEFNVEDINSIIELLIYDKKNVNGKVYFVLLNHIGSYKINCEVSNDLIFNSFEYYKKL